jgi:hypothetical protein
METRSLAAALRGRATGVLFFGCFGALWIALALLGAHRMGSPELTLVALGWIALVSPACWLLRRTGPAAVAKSKDASDLQRERVFRTVNIAQWVAIGIAVPLLSLLHLDLYIPPVIAVIVGLHLLPLARLFHYPLHFLTGAALIAWAIGIALGADAADVAFLTALGVGLILWLSAWVTLARSLVLYRGARPALLAS